MTISLLIPRIGLLKGKILKQLFAFWNKLLIKVLYNLYHLEKLWAHF